MTADTRDDRPARLTPAAMPAPETAAAKPRRRNRRRIHLPITAVLMLGFGGLMLVAVASVLMLGLITTGRNTSDLLDDKARLLMDSLETRVRAQLDPARAQVEFLAHLVADAQIDTKNEAELARHLQTALAAGPKLTGAGFLTLDGDFILANRRGTTDVEINVERNVPWASEALEFGKSIGGAVWIDPIWADDIGTSILTVQMPMRRDGRFLGLLLTGVSFIDLSRFLSDLKEQVGIDAFILFDDDYVLAHPALQERKFDFAAIDQLQRPPLPTLEELGDPVVAGIWQKIGPDGVSTGFGAEAAGRSIRIDLNLENPASDIFIREANLAEGDYVYLFKKMTDYGEKPWTMGIAFPQDEVTVEFRRMGRMATAGLIILIVSVLLALWLGQRISRQISRLARVAVAVRDLDFAAVPTLPDSRLREMSDAATAFNTMVAGLRWFETYVPKALVLRLIDREAGPCGIASEERVVTVMFTDIRGFSTLAQRLTPQQTADWLNAHFTRIAGFIEAEGGTVDKFIGDAVMAFWGAPDPQVDHAARAVRAAHAIEAWVRAEAKEAELTGQPPVCLRIGIHSGPVVVGNIGAASRMNYTIVGDTVNTAARLEALGSELIGDDSCVVLVSADTIAAAGHHSGQTQELGLFALRGRSGSLLVHRLRTGPLPDPCL